VGGGAVETRFGKIDSPVNSASLSGSRRMALLRRVGLKASAEHELLTHAFRAAAPRRW
jgi:hypothetical protein